MHLDDASMTDLDESRFSTALTPKMLGALVLDELTRGHPLDFFVAFSSMTTLVENYRQANYVAGNLFLEALVRARRHRGLPGLAVAWAGIRDVGYVARHGLADALTAAGVYFLSPDEALDALGELLGLPDDVISVGGLDWARAAAVFPLVKTPRLSGLLPPLVEGTDYRQDEFLDILANLSPPEAIMLLEDTLARMVAGIPHTQPERVDRNRPLDQIGMDSLMAVELVTMSWEQLHCKIPLMEIATSAGTIHAVS